MSAEDSPLWEAASRFVDDATGDLFEIKRSAMIQNIVNIIEDGPCDFCAGTVNSHTISCPSVIDEDD